MNRKTLERLLGPPPYLLDKPEGPGEVGVANGLAWTESGGEVLTLESTMTPGSGLVLTGQIGDVMKESGHAAFTWARGRGAELGFDAAMFGRHEVHVHVPAGAIPKDGPSAGIAIATAILSLATRIRIRSDVAMTGEVTLRGRVLPVGGVREKALAALRAGIRRVILPRKNLQDLRDIPRDLKKKITFIPVDHMDEVLDAALDRTPVPRSRRAGRPHTPAPDRDGEAALIALRLDCVGGIYVGRRCMGWSLLSHWRLAGDATACGGYRPRPGSPRRRLRVEAATGEVRASVEVNVRRSGSPGASPERLSPKPACRRPCAARRTRPIDDGRRSARSSDRRRSLDRRGVERATPRSRSASCSRASDGADVDDRPASVRLTASAMAREALVSGHQDPVRHVSDWRAEITPSSVSGPPSDAGRTRLLRWSWMRAASDSAERRRLQGGDHRQLRET